MTKGKIMHENQRVADMADEVLEPQARDRAEGTGEPFEEALKAVVIQLSEVPDG